MSLTTPESVQKLQTALHDKAKKSPDFRFYALYDKVYRKDVLTFAYECCKAKGGAAGVDGQRFEDIEAYGAERWMDELTQELKSRTYQPLPVRRVVDAVKLNKQDVASIRAVKLMDELFAIDAQARDDNMDHARRHALRQQKAPPLLDQIRSHILATSKMVLPKSAAGQASSYALAIWTRLTCFLDYPELELSNNLAENSMRPIALGRSNWIHTGSEHAGPRIAAIFSVVESGRRLNIPIRDYLADILPGVADTPLQCIAELTPAAWAARHPHLSSVGLL
jgi:hypothetical protein